MKIQNTNNQHVDTFTNKFITSQHTHTETLSSENFRSSYLNRDTNDLQFI